jgi:SlyX protein
MKELEKRLTDLEIRYTHQQSTIDTLSDLVREQQEAIERLNRELRQCIELVGPDTPPHEKPPHY